MPQGTALAYREQQNPLTSRDVFQFVGSSKSETLPPPVLKIARLFDGQRSLADVARLSQFSEEKTCAVVRKLTTLGALKALPEPVRTGNPVAQTRQPTRQPTLRGLPPLGSKDFNALEEAFFNAELEPIDECDEPFVSLSERVSSFFTELALRLKSSQVL